ncbi:sugar phosphate isomerase/epimerase [Saliphagus sp. LR7]|uniref:sugar phosphate isomerase/epimerase family protein n=1 Tax=Saliphagus sp. LR7 TaxID=2282654 RepID=UPI000DF73A0F|nr:sugar phosphate isomerase/epimerase family protein [Saliphagus sp. LR7]
MPPRDGHVVLSGFADEIAESFDEQLEVLEREGIGALDLRTVDGSGVLDLSDEEVEDVRERLDRAGVAVSSIGSPIGKIPITDDFEPHFEEFERAIELAGAFDADYVRLFSYYIPEGDEPETHREEVLRRMERKAARAEEAGVVLVHENEKRIYGDTPGRCRDVFESVDSPALRAAFDPANFLEIGVSPYPEALLDLIEYVEQLHVKDCVYGEEGAIRVAGEGDGSFSETVAALDRRGWEGYASLEPHLDIAGERSGFSGPEGYGRAAEAFRGVLEEEGVSYE